MTKPLPKATIERIIRRASVGKDAGERQVYVPSKMELPWLEVQASKGQVTAPYSAPNRRKHDAYSSEKA